MSVSGSGRGSASGWRPPSFRCSIVAPVMPPDRTDGPHVLVVDPRRNISSSRTAFHAAKLLSRRRAAAALGTLIGRRVRVFFVNWPFLEPLQDGAFRVFRQERHQPLSGALQ